MRARIWLIGATVVAGLAAGCGTSPSGGAKVESSTAANVPDGVTVIDSVMPVNGIDRVPANTLEDVAGFADVAAVIEVEREVLQDPKTAINQGGEGLIGRELTVRVVNAPWVREGKRSPTSVELRGPAFKVNGNEWTPLSDTGGVRLETGRRYLALLTEFTSGEPTGWKLLSGHSFFEIQDGRVAVPKGTQDAVAIEFAGLTPEEVGKRIAATEPLPEVKAVSDLDPDARNAAAS